MRATLLALLVAGLAGSLVGGLAWLLLFRSSGAIAPSEAVGAGDQTEHGQPKVVPARVTTDLPAAQPKAMQTEAEREREIAKEVPVPESAPSPANLVIVALDRVTRTPLPNFRTTLRRAGQPSAQPEEKQHQGGEARLALELDKSFELTIEADDHLPHGPLPVEITSEQKTKELRVELERAVPLAGVVLTVLDAKGLPAPRIALAAWALRDDGEKQEPALWQRGTAASDGVYKLPDLQAGAYALEIAAVDDQGDPLPLLPVTKTVRFRGGEQVPVSVQLQAGALVRLVVKDPAGQVLGTQVLARLIQDQVALPTRWRGRKDGVLAVRRDALPVSGEAHLERAVAPGRYTLEVARAGAAPVLRELALGPLAIEVVEIVLP